MGTNVGSWYKQFGLIETPVDFEFHLDENDVVDAERVFENIRVIEINNCNVEFGFEEEKTKDNKHKVKICFGFAHVIVDRTIFEEALKHFRLKETIGMDILKSNLKKVETKKSSRK